MSTQLHFTITETHHIAEARREITTLAKKLTFNETEAGKVALIVTEAATNLVKHATQGELLARPLEKAGHSGLEILALDRGPGLANVRLALQDGYSTAGSPGTGLGAISRLATVFDIHSVLGKGTALLAQLWPPEHSLFNPKSAGSVLPLEIGVICLAKPGQEVSGDNWAIAQRSDGGLLMVADGLGHGPQAAAASQAAVGALTAQPGLHPAAILEVIHAALRHTRGAAVAVVELDFGRGVVRFAGVGNISGVILAADSTYRLASHNGIVGQHMRKTQEFTYPWSADAVLVLHSDGLAGHWEVKSYPGLLTRHPSLVAGVLYRDCGRGNDDVTVLVAKQI